MSRRYPHVDIKANFSFIPGNVTRNRLHLIKELTGRRIISKGNQFGSQRVGCILGKEKKKENKNDNMIIIRHPFYHGTLDGLLQKIQE